MPAARWLIAAAALSTASLALAVLIFWKYFSALQEPVRFIAPGRANIEVPEPGRYVIWHEHRSLFQGRSYDVPGALPHGSRYHVLAPDGSEAQMEAYRGATMQAENAARASVARFDAARSGRYTVEVEGSFEPRVIAVQRDLLWPAIRVIGVAAAIVVVGCGAALALALYAFLQALPAARGTGDAAPAGAERERALAQLTAVVYGLQAASLLVGFTLLAALLVNYMKRGEVAGTWLESHFIWQIRTFWWSLLWAIVGLATLVLLVGIPVLLASAVWFIYRVVKGWISLEDRRPMYAD